MDLARPLIWNGAEDGFASGPGLEPELHGGGGNALRLGRDFPGRDSGGKPGRFDFNRSGEAIATRDFDGQLGRLPGGERDPVLGHLEREVGFGMRQGEQVNEPRTALTVEVADDHIERAVVRRGEVDLGVTPRRVILLDEDLARRTRDPKDRIQRRPERTRLDPEATGLSLLAQRPGIDPGPQRVRSLP